MNISHIHYAVEVAHYGSFNKAAANLFVSQPSLSRAIKEMENLASIYSCERPMALCRRIRERNFCIEPSI